jgi:hypothetical protein
MSNPIRSEQWGRLAIDGIGFINYKLPKRLILTSSMISNVSANFLENTDVQELRI